MIIYPSTLQGAIKAPPSKSLLHRYIIASSLSESVTIIENIELSDDIRATLDCIKEFNADYKIENSSLIIKGIKKKDLFNNCSKRVFNVRESGSTLRFLIPISLLSLTENEFVCGDTLLKRPQETYFDIFKKNNISYEYSNNILKVKGLLKPDTYNINTEISSQFISGMLFALPLLNDDSIINIDGVINSKSYIDLTIDVLKKFNINIDFNGSCLKIFKDQNYTSKGHYTIESDYSNCAYLDCYNYIENNHLKLINIDNNNSLQQDKDYRILFERLKKGYTVIDVSQNIDLSPILMVFSSLFYGGEFLNTDRLFYKESNRGKNIITELAKFGVESEFYENKIIIKKCKIHPPTSVINTYSDHRMVMALVFLLSITGGEIDNPSCVNKSFPSFFDKLKSVGLRYEC